MLYFLNPDDLLIPNIIIDTSPWSSCSRRPPWLPCSGHTVLQGWVYHCFGIFLRKQVCLKYIINIYLKCFDQPQTLSIPFRKLHIGEAGLSLVQRLEANRTHWPIYGLSSHVCSYHGPSMAICCPDSSFQSADGALCVRDGPFRCV